MIVLKECSIPDIKLVEVRRFCDERGYFAETWNRKEWFAAGIDCDFVQDNESSSSYGVIRGLHYQAGARMQAKLVRVIYGKVLDVCVDIRRGSPWFGRMCAVVLDGEKAEELFIPRGFAHGFAVLSERAVFAYKCDNFYDPASERGILLSDPDLGIDWQIPEQKRIINSRDRAFPLLRDAADLPEFNK